MARVTREDRDGVRIVTTGDGRSGTGWLVLALGLVAVAVFIIVRPALPRGGDQAPVRQSQPLARASGGSGVAVPRRRAVPIERAKLPPRPAAETVAAPALDSAAPDDPLTVSPSQGDSEVDGPTGIALFPPPGTDPIKTGIVVPESFELPPGYVRHYQTTDDGKQLPAILMFHPDFELVGEGGERIALPADRIVPVDLAPVGLTIEMLAVPDTQVPMLEEEGNHEEHEEHEER